MTLIPVIMMIWCYVIEMVFTTPTNCQQISNGMFCSHSKIYPWRKKHYRVVGSSRMMILSLKHTLHRQLKLENHIYQRDYCEAMFSILLFVNSINEHQFIYFLMHQCPSLLDELLNYLINSLTLNNNILLPLWFQDYKLFTISLAVWILLHNQIVTSDVHEKLFKVIVILWCLVKLRYIVLQSCAL